MAPTTVFVFFLSFILRTSLSMPMALEVKTMQLNAETVLTEKTILDAETIHNLEEKTKLVQSLGTETVLNGFQTVEADHGKRIRRGIIIPKVLCPEDRIQYGNQCLTKEQFDKINDVLEDSDDYKEES